MKKILLLLAFALPSVSFSQVFYTETFDGTPCAAGSGCDPSLILWTTTNVSANGATANKFYVSDTESGLAAGQCGVGGGGDQSLHVGNVAGSFCAAFACPSGDCGAAYDACTATEITDKRCESPTISCVGQSNITISFNYMEFGEGANDDASLVYFDGTTWTTINPLAKTLCCDFFTGDPIVCDGSSQGLWTSFSFALPASANNNANVKIGFRWVNDGNGNGGDPSFAVDDITLTSSTTSPPVASFTASDQTICSTVTNCINFTNTSTGGPFTSTSWTFTGGTPSTSTDANPTNICYSTPGTYDVSLTVTDANGTDTETQVGFITVSNCASPPVASFTASDQTPCTSDCIDFTNTSTGGPFTATSWTFTGGTPSTSTDANPIGICYNTPGTYQVSLTVTDANGTDTETQTGFITVSDCASPPVASFTSNVQTICVGGSVDFTDLSTNNPTSWSWTFNGGTPATSTSQNPSIIYNTVGTYLVSLTATNSAGSNTNIQNSYITVVDCPPPTSSFTLSDNSICEGECISITNTSTDGTSFAWTFTGGTPPSSISQDPGSICYLTAGNYTISLTVTNATGSATTTENIVVSSTPTVTASGDTIVDLGNVVPIVAIGSGSGTYSWTPTSGVTCNTCSSTTVLPQTSSYYVVEYTEGGCTVSDSVYIEVNIIESIEVPNAFSPNGDANNDVLFVLGQGIYSMHLKIYNRYGQLVFESMDQADGWDGTHNGKDANTGVFAYTLEYTLSSGSVLSKKGNITLVR